MHKLDVLCPIFFRALCKTKKLIMLILVEIKQIFLIFALKKSYAPSYAMLHSLQY